MTSPSSSPATHGDALPSGYRPWLDAIRGLAVIGVVVEHVFSGEGPRVLQGLGETGVAMFFGLSGYLITGLLLGELARTGRVRLGEFYLRRAARLLPALVLVLVVADLGFWLTGRDGFLRPTAYALAYVANYATVLEGGYLMGFGQTWSLAVEEHFYLVWPLVLLVAARRGGVMAVLRVALAGCVVALLWRLGLVLTVDPALLLYHGSLERADALLYGCAAAAAVPRGGVRRGGCRPCRSSRSSGPSSSPTRDPSGVSSCRPCSGSRRRASPWVWTSGRVGALDG